VLGDQATWGYSVLPENTRSTLLGELVDNGGSAGIDAAMHWALQDPSIIVRQHVFECLNFRAAGRRAEELLRDSSEELARPIHDARGLPIRSGGFEWRRVRSFGVFAARTPTLSERVGGMGLGEQGRRPRRSGTARHERGGQRGEEISVWARGGESQADAACHFDDAGGDFDELEA
jgi:hypothetical protein